MTNADGTIWVTFNGEIYNFQELRPLLEGHGHRFLTNSDTESILHGYRAVGRRLRAATSAACSPSGCGTRRDRTLLLARDRVGKKPLFYAQAGGAIPLRLGNAGDARTPRHQQRD